MESGPTDLLGKIPMAGVTLPSNAPARPIRVSPKRCSSDAVGLAPASPSPGLFAYRLGEGGGEFLHLSVQATGIELPERKAFDTLLEAKKLIGR